MATDSTTPPSNSDDKPQNPVTGAEQASDTTKEVPGKSIYMNSEPMREEQVQNAVKFLSHPKVRGSPVMYRRSFLEKKGLTKEEIDEAFRRVPDPSPSATNAPITTQVQDDQSKSPGLQSHVSTQPSQPVAATAGAISAVSTPLQSRFHWSHAVIAVGVLAASGVGSAVIFKNAVIPRLKSWIRKVVNEDIESEKKEGSKPTLAEEAAAAAKAAAAAASDVARASQELLNSKNEEKKYLESLMNLLDVQVSEMKSMGSALRKLEATREATYPPDKYTENSVQSSSGNGPSNNNAWGGPRTTDQLGSRTSTVMKQTNGAVDIEVGGSVRPSSAPASMEPTSRPKSYMEIMAMVQRGEKPPGIKPWESHNSSNYGFQYEMRGEGLSSEGQINGFSQMNGKSNNSRGDSPDSWWRQRTVKISEIEPEKDDQSAASYDERPIPRRWVPPQPPSVVIPEAAEAIRKPKPSIQEQVLEEQSKSPASENNEPVKAINASESVVDIKSPDQITEPSPSERPEEPQNSIEVN